MEEVKSGGSRLSGTMSGCLLVLAASFAALVGGAAVTAYHLFFAEGPAASQEGDGSSLRETTALITSMRQLSILQTASYHLERVIDLRDRQSHLFGVMRSEDAILLVAAADVTAGVDLSSLREEDVQLDPVAKAVRIVLPPPMILSARLDNERTYVHTRRTDTLALRQETLETRARQQAERGLRQAALEAGILERARAGAAQTLAMLVRSLGFELVQVDFREE